MITLKRNLGSTLAQDAAAIAVHAFQAQPRTPGYVITDIDVTEAAAFAEYAPKVEPSFALFGGRYVVRGGKTQSLTGDAPKRVVVLAFDGIDQVRAWYDSPQYEALKALRDKAGKARIFAVEGVAPQPA